jgi:hypothetical protein
MEMVSLNKLIRFIFRQTMVCPLEAQKYNVNFLGKSLADFEQILIK